MLFSHLLLAVTTAVLAAPRSVDLAQTARSVDAPAAKAAFVSMKASDGKAVTGRFTPAAAPAKAPAVVLVCDEGRSASEWDRAATKLAAAGFSALAIQTRSKPAGVELAASSQDIAGAIAWLRARKDIDTAHVFLAGAGASALAALRAAQKDLAVSGVAAISVSLDRDRLDDEDVLARYGARPIFVAVARGDKKGAKSALVLESNAKGRRKMFIADGSRAGAELLSDDDAALEAFLVWARELLGAESAPATP